MCSDADAAYADLAVRAGDRVTVSVYARAPAVGVTTITNHLTRRSVAQQLASGHLLCGKGASWIVEDLCRPAVPLAGSGEVVSSGVQATTAGGVVGPEA
ncbi:peptidase A4 family-domain-containing protein [Phanerochaete sordida]|uniref:Peptidase A4 family-domain-containing protein n=1 Tax=Phanerochaete sordida TaxID=48140 RepID=A0A9P3GQC1_9APHY|nr:peptidase A4 family-domain-containing protein [Phanerochaete sordida]